MEFQSKMIIRNLAEQENNSVIPTDTKEFFSPVLSPSSIFKLWKNFLNNFLSCNL